MVRRKSNHIANLGNYAHLHSKQATERKKRDDQEQHIIEEAQTSFVDVCSGESAAVKTEGYMLEPDSARDQVAVAQMPFEDFLDPPQRSFDGSDADTTRCERAEMSGWSPQIDSGLAGAERDATALSQRGLGQEILQAYEKVKNIQLNDEELEDPVETALTRAELVEEVAEEMAQHMDPTHLLRTYTNQSMKHLEDDGDDIEAEAPEAKRIELDQDLDEALLLECRRLGSLYAVQD